MFKTPPRADALLFIESRGQVTPAATPAATAATADRSATLPSNSFHGRY
jgi:hypothetical protein